MKQILLLLMLCVISFTGRSQTTLYRGVVRIDTIPVIYTYIDTSSMTYEYMQNGKPRIQKEYHSLHFQMWAYGFITQKLIGFNFDEEWMLDKNKKRLDSNIIVTWSKQLKW